MGGGLAILSKYKLLPAILPTMGGRGRGQKWVVDFASVIFLFKLYII